MALAATGTASAANETETKAKNKRTRNFKSNPQTLRFGPSDFGFRRFSQCTKPSQPVPGPCVIALSFRILVIRHFEPALHLIVDIARRCNRDPVCNPVL